MGRAERVQFASLCDLLDAVVKPRTTPAERIELVRDWREQFLTGVRVHPPDIAARGHPPRRPAAQREREARYPPVPLDQVGDVFAVYRLLLPKQDTERARLGMKEARLAAAICAAANLDPKTSEQARQVVEWRATLPDAGRAARHRYGGAPARASVHALADRAADNIFYMVCPLGGTGPRATEETRRDEYRRLTVATVNAALADLAAAPTTEAAADVLRELYKVTSARTMRWIVRIALADGSAGLPRDGVLRDYHPDAPRAMRSLSNMHRVLTQLADPAARCEDARVVLGAAAQPQKGRAVASAARALAAVGGGPYAVETKLDGYRIQVHVDGASVKYFSPAAVDHGARDFAVLDPAILAAVAGAGPAPRLVLDGELVIWNKARAAFDPFGGVMSVVKAAADPARSPADRMDEHPPAGFAFDWTPARLDQCEVTYCAFDLLREGDVCVADQPLDARHAALARVLGVAGFPAAAPASPPFPALAPGVPIGAGIVTARVEALLPGVPFMGGPPQSALGADAATIDAAFRAAEERGDEGVMVKAVAAPWTPGDKRNWCKLKPEHASALDVDALILGARYGRAAGRAGLLSEYVLGLRRGGEVPETGEEARWVTFCRVGTGLSDDARARLHARLLALPHAPHPPPSVHALGSASDRADVWFTQPWRSEVVAVQADVRALPSSKFAAAYSLRFPRITRLRGEAADLADKDWTGVLAEEELVAIVRESGRLPGGRDHASVGGGGRRGKRVRQVVPAQRAPDLGEAVDDGPLTGEDVYVALAPAADALRAKRAAAALGARVFASAPAGPALRILAADPAHHAAAAAAQGGARAVLSVDWLDWVDRGGDGGDGAAARAPPPRFFLALGAGPAGRPADADAYGDPYYVASTVADVRAVLARFMAPRPPAPRGGGRRGAAAIAAAAAHPMPLPPLPSAHPALVEPALAAGEAALADAGRSRVPRALAGVRVWVARPPRPPAPPCLPATPSAAAAALVAAAAAADAAEAATAAGVVAAAVAAGGARAVCVAAATHVVVLPPAAPPARPGAVAPPNSADSVLAGVWEGGGDAGAADLAALRAALAAGRAALVSPAWVAAAGGGVRPCEADFWPAGVEADPEAAWPWGSYGVAPPPPLRQPARSPAPAPAPRRVKREGGPAASRPAPRAKRARAPAAAAAASAAAAAPAAPAASSAGPSLLDVLDGGDGLSLSLPAPSSAGAGGAVGSLLDLIDGGGSAADAAPPPAPLPAPSAPSQGKKRSLLDVLGD